MATCLVRSDAKFRPFRPETVYANLAGLRLQSGDKNNSNDDRDDGNDAGLATKTRTKVKRPSLYRVLLLNDDYTPMEFVVAILQQIFNRDQDEAIQIMMHVHNHGVGECGIYPYEVAESKVTMVMDAARKNQHPLQCVMEKQ